METNYQDRRYLVGWEARELRFVVFVVDKLAHRIVYTTNVPDKLKAYPYIKNYYGETNCVPPKERKMADYQNY